MVPSLRELDEVHATVDQVTYSPHLEAPDERPFPFVYFISIHNDSDQAITIRGRKWVVTDRTGQKIVIEGDGVVGQQPRIEPGEAFSYNSFHVIGSNSIAEGSFLGLGENGTPVLIRIPSFEMRVPV